MEAERGGVSEQQSETKIGAKLVCVLAIENEQQRVDESPVAAREGRGGYVCCFSERRSGFLARSLVISRGQRRAIERYSHVVNADLLRRNCQAVAGTLQAAPFEGGEADRHDYSVAGSHLRRKRCFHGVLLPGCLNAGVVGCELAESRRGGPAHVY